MVHGWYHASKINKKQKLYLFLFFNIIYIYSYIYYLLNQDAFQDMYKNSPTKLCQFHNNLKIYVI